MQHSHDVSEPRQVHDVMSMASMCIIRSTLYHAQYRQSSMPLARDQQYFRSTRDSSSDSCRALLLAALASQGLMARDEDPEMAGAVDDPAVTIQQAWFVSYGKGKKWMPETVVKQEMVFAKLSKYDSGLVYFCLGERMSSSSKGDKVMRSANVPAFNALLEQRQLKSQEMVEKAMEMEPEEPGDSIRQRRQKRRVRSEDVHLVSPVVQIELPEVTGHQKTSVNVLWGVKSQDLWLELTVTNLQHIKALVKSGQAEKCVRKRSSPKKKQRKLQHVGDDK